MHIILPLPNMKMFIIVVYNIIPGLHTFVFTPAVELDESRTSTRTGNFEEEMIDIFKYIRMIPICYEQYIS